MVIRDTGDSNHGIFDDKKLTKVSTFITNFIIRLNPVENNLKFSTLSIKV